MIKLRTDRNLDLIEEKNQALLDRIIQALNELDDDDFVDVLYGNRGSLSFLQSGRGTFKLCDERCICGNIDNVRCQWLEEGEQCRDVFCPHFIDRNFVKEDSDEKTD